MSIYSKRKVASWRLPKREISDQHTIEKEFAIGLATIEITNDRDRRTYTKDMEFVIDLR